MAAAEAATSDAMDFGLILEAVLCRRTNCRLNIGVKNEGCSTAAAGPMSVKMEDAMICAHRTRPREHGRTGGREGCGWCRGVSGGCARRSDSRSGRDRQQVRR